MEFFIRCLDMSKLPTGYGSSPFLIYQVFINKEKTDIQILRLPIDKNNKNDIELMSNLDNYLQVAKFDDEKDFYNVMSDIFNINYDDFPTHTAKYWHHLTGKTVEEVVSDRIERWRTLHY
jgi:hypothetical protein